jgi:DNA-directed RNA polymerase specialized sigma24 family protein
MEYEHMKTQGESNVSRVGWLGHKASARGEYASNEEFAGVFESERAGLQRLALLLTANKEVANQCLIRASRECIASSSVFRGWVLKWARRVVIRNAISLILGRGGQSSVNANGDADNGLIAFAPDDSPSAPAEFESVLDLPDVERFVLVICVLEGYSPHDCALLLGRSPREIDEVRKRIANQIVQIGERTNNALRFVMSSAPLSRVKEHNEYHFILSE